MGIGVSILLLAIGAILAFAVEMDVSGLDLSVVGVILMIVGAIGVLASLMWAETFSRRREGTVVEERHVLR